MIVLYIIAKSYVYNLEFIVMIDCYKYLHNVKHFVAPVCFNTTYCGGESVSDNLLSYEQCCFELSGASFASSGQCLLCPKTGKIKIIHNYIYVQCYDVYIDYITCESKRHMWLYILWHDGSLAVSWCLDYSKWLIWHFLLIQIKKCLQHTHT